MRLCFRMQSWGVWLGSAVRNHRVKSSLMENQTSRLPSKVAKETWHAHPPLSNQPIGLEIWLQRLVASAMGLSITSACDDGAHGHFLNPGRRSHSLKRWRSHVCPGCTTHTNFGPRVTPRLRRPHPNWRRRMPFVGGEPGPKLKTPGRRWSLS